MCTPYCAVLDSLITILRPTRDAQFPLWFLSGFKPGPTGPTGNILFELSVMRSELIR